MILNPDPPPASTSQCCVQYQTELTCVGGSSASLYGLCYLLGFVVSSACLGILPGLDPELPDKEVGNTASSEEVELRGLGSKFEPLSGMCEDRGSMSSWEKRKYIIKANNVRLKEGPSILEQNESTVKGPAQHRQEVLPS